MTFDTTTVAPPIAYNIDTAAAAVGLSRVTISRAISSRELVAHYPTSRPSIRHADLEAWIMRAPTNLDRPASDDDAAADTLPLGLD